MPIDRVLWRERISSDRVPNWPCPRCGATSLNVRKDSFSTVSDAETAQAEDSPDFDGDKAKGRFVCLLTCSKEECRESCSVSGYFDTWMTGNDQAEWTYPAGRAYSITPPPRMIHVPRVCPTPIRDQVWSAFGLYWLDWAASLNRIRIAIEMLLTEMGIRRYSIKKGKPRTVVSLDSRIQMLRSKRPALGTMCDRLLAVKHLGNAGSHPGEVTDEDVFDGLDILEHILGETYENHASVLAKMVKQINTRKGPRRKTK